MMNERIKKLIEQATSRPHRSQGFGGEPTHIYPGTLDPEKFAELIIKECAKVAWYHTPDTEDLEYSHLIKDKILKHFRVKE